MSKAIKWQIPFISTIDKIRYRIDIYAEGYTGTPIQLTGGTTPIKTEENKSDDFFAPVRGQTGTIEVVTKLPNGGTLDINDMLPANNIDHPVRLVSISGSTETVEWQGFMSCEAFSQNYTSVPDTFSFPIISVLEAMASVQADPAMLSGLNNVGETIQQLLEIFIKKAGVSYFSQYYIPTIARGRNILSKYIDATVLYEQKEYNNENSTTYIVSGLSLQDCLARIATYMGWCCREVSASLFFFAATENSGYMRFYRLGEVTPGGQITIRWLADFNYTAVVNRDIAALLWAGVDHKRSVQQGAKSVEVVANLEKYDVRLLFPEFPYADLSTFEVSMRTIVNHGYGQRITVYSIVSSNITLSNIHTFNQLELSNDKSTGTPTTIANVIGDAIINPNGAQYSSSYVGAFMARIKQDNGEYQDGIFLSFLGFVDYVQYSAYVPTSTNYTYSVRSMQSYYLSGGRLKLKTEGVSFYGGDTGRCWSDGIGVIVKSACIKFGDKYWDGQQWVDSFTTVGYNPMFEDGYYIMPITSPMRGELQVFLYPNHDETIIPADYEQGYEIGAFLTGLSVDYEMDNSEIATDRGANHYYRLLGTNFSDEVSISTELASMLNNQPSPSLIMEDATTPMKELNYGSSQSPDMRRPEVDLLNRLATYYGAARQRLSLIIAHPTAAPLPLLRLNGISPDSRTYAPLAESRDWKEDTCTLTCFEVPEEQLSES